MVKRVKEEEFTLFQHVTRLLERGIEEGMIREHPLPLLTAFAFFPLITLLKFHIGGTIKMDEGRIADACEIAWNAISSNCG